jgi:branched-chain amino acid transport system ATP-binding protein
MNVALMTNENSNLLNVKNLKVSYSGLNVLKDVSFEVKAGECVAILGRNGAGKSTLLKALMGALSEREGVVQFKDSNILPLSTYQIALSGLSLCPDYRGILSSLSVKENFSLASPINIKKKLSDEKILELFPFLKERWKNMGFEISGGEQQMLAIARTLRLGSDLIMLDEPTEGLSPLMRKNLSNTLRSLKALGMSMLIVEQHIEKLKGLADRFYVLHLGEIKMCFKHDEYEKKIKEAEEFLTLKN